MIAAAGPVFSMNHWNAFTSSVLDGLIKSNVRWLDLNADAMFLRIRAAIGWTWKDYSFHHSSVIVLSLSVTAIREPSTRAFKSPTPHNLSQSGFAQA